MDTPAQITNRELAELFADVRLMKLDISHIKSKFDGNGSPSFDIRIDRLEREIDETCKQLVAFRSTIYKIVWTFGVAFFMFVAGLVYSLLTHQIEIVFK